MARRKNLAQKDREQANIGQGPTVGISESVAWEPDQRTTVAVPTVTITTTTTTKGELTMSKSMFRAQPDGFAITFANGWTVSVRHGKWHYCNNRIGQSDGRSCPNAEVAVINPDGKFVGDDVLGWQSPDQVAAIITETANKGKHVRPSLVLRED